MQFCIHGVTNARRGLALTLLGIAELLVQDTLYSSINSLHKSMKYRVNPKLLRNRKQ
ncbi:hypothetical protein Poly21_42000 [Allorhodopirellula heiligendammensis]|uniref:Uncharacterized protein n=1 Tax=Allorhodopirellula heiligendammensis TaxID=2714739 RepID=A0A5C6C030_9BACT|nr:hypothetical protein Poly21_42000 [Allorhodopirellula heiligendammensis]